MRATFAVSGRLPVHLLPWKYLPRSLYAVPRHRAGHRDRRTAIPVHITQTAVPLDLQQNALAPGQATAPRSLCTSSAGRLGICCPSRGSVARRDPRRRGRCWSRVQRWSHSRHSLWRRSHLRHIGGSRHTAGYTGGGARVRAPSTHRASSSVSRLVPAVPGESRRLEDQRRIGGGRLLQSVGEVPEHTELGEDHGAGRARVRPGRREQRGRRGRCRSRSGIAPRPRRRRARRRGLRGAGSAWPEARRRSHGSGRRRPRRRPRRRA
jgi:hypothetical protein